MQTKSRILATLQQRAQAWSDVALRYELQKVSGARVWFADLQFCYQHDYGILREMQNYMCVASPFFIISLYVLFSYLFLYVLLSAPVTFMLVNKLIT